MTHCARPHILLTNDDGIDAPGLRAASEALAGLGDLLVVAPACQQTAMGRAHGGDPGARLIAVPWLGEARAFSLEATPATVVRHALQALCSRKRPALVVSGINHGENVGSGVTVSGTVGAAFEAAAHGVPALAVSLQMDMAAIRQNGDADWSAARFQLRRFAESLLADGLPPGVDVLKVDIPDTATCDTPWRLTRLSRQPYVNIILDGPSTASRLGEARLELSVRPEPGTDVHALAIDRVVSVTPLSLDCTSKAAPSALQAWLDSSTLGVA